MAPSRNWRNFALLYGAGFGGLLLVSSAIKLLFAAIAA